MSDKKRKEEMMRATGLLVIEVIDSNPNGDPDRESDPRQRNDERGEISPVSFKRKLRDLVIHKEGPVWQAIKKDLGLKDDEFDILESRGRKRDEIKKLSIEAFKKKYWDARIFGNTFLEEKKKEATKDTVEGSNIIRTGVVQFGLGVSVAPIAIERMTNTSKAGVEGGKDRGMAPLAYRIVQHGVYCMPFFVNPSVASASGCTVQDIKVMLKLIPYAYPHTRSYIRSNVELRHAWYIEHNSALGSCSDFSIISALTPTKEDSSVSSENWDDYNDPKELPSEIKNKINSSSDLIEEMY